MNIANSPSVRSATAGAQSANADAIQFNVLRKALNTQAAAAATLLQGMYTRPQRPNWQKAAAWAHRSTPSPELALQTSAGFNPAAWF